ncbi:MAG: EAL domain-containing protein, partial [Cyanobacteria bacterium P01_F01_bin.4]
SPPPTTGKTAKTRRRRSTKTPCLYQVVSTIIALGNQLGLKVVAEGIETPQQLQQLQQLGCQLGQGYLFSSPLPADAIEAQFFAIHAHQRAHSTFLIGPD